MSQRRHSVENGQVKVLILAGAEAPLSLGSTTIPCLASYSHDDEGDKESQPA